LFASYFSATFLFLSICLSFAWLLAKVQLRDQQGRAQVLESEPPQTRDATQLELACPQPSTAKYRNNASEILNWF
jgi:hypothetical protein